jgi:hypothetical protein
VSSGGMAAQKGAAGMFLKPDKKEYVNDEYR